MSEGVWLFARGSQTAHFIVTGSNGLKLLCGRRTVHTEGQPYLDGFLAEKYKCKSCRKALKKQALQFSDKQGEQTKCQK